VTEEIVTNTTRHFGGRDAGLAATEGEITAALEKYLSGDPTLANQGGFAAKFAERYPPNPDAVMGFLAERGMTLSDLSHYAVRGEGISQWLSHDPNISPHRLEVAAQLEAQAKQGNIKIKGFSQGATQGAGGAPLANVKLPPLSRETTQKLRSLASVPAPSPVKAADGGTMNLADQYDIWHTHWTQTLFDIVSDRLKQARMHQQNQGHSMK
jgi:hypothetical protein